MKRFLFLAIASLAVLTSDAQIRIRTITDNDKQAQVSTLKRQRVKKHSIQPKPVEKSTAFIGPDTLYASSTKKQHGWISPLRVITPEEARHITPVYRFTRRNKQGNWCKLEVLDGYGKYYPGAFAPYILNLNSADSDSLANSEWTEKLINTCIYEFIADPAGVEVIQERAFDSTRKIVYTYSRTPIGKTPSGRKRYIGSYKDFYGLPAEMRKDPGYAYGTLVRLTEDRWGNDSIVEFTDAKGKNKPNSDGAYMSVYVCDRAGRLLRQQSHNNRGQLTIDNWGNCGVDYTWNADGNIASAMYMDNHWQPMRMPANRSVNKQQNIIRTAYKYDRYGREIEESFTLPDGTPDINAFGAHKITYTFNDRGYITRIEGFDLEGNRSPYDNSSTAIQLRSFDDQGRLTDYRFLDKDSLPCSAEGYLSAIHIEYDDKGAEKLREEYAISDGEERLCSRISSEKDLWKRLYTDGSYAIDSIDQQGRRFSETYYTADGRLEKVNDWAKRLTTYKDAPGNCTETIHCYDQNGELAEINGVATTVNQYDSTTCVRLYRAFDRENRMREIFLQEWNEGFQKVLSQTDANRFGIPCRAGGSSSVRFYKANVQYAPQSNMNSLIGRDEFDEPDYIETSTGMLYYYQKMAANGNTRCFDEHNEEITDFNALRDRLPKVMSIEVTDSSAYEIGLRDNDIIVIYGDYVIEAEDISDYVDFRARWTLHSVMEARKEKRMVVFRTDPVRKTARLFEIKGLKGPASQLGFTTHVRFLTDRQLERLISTVQNEYESENPLIDPDDFDGSDKISGENTVVLGYPNLYRSVLGLPYGQHIKDPSVLLATCIKDLDMEWTTGNDEELLEALLASRRNSASVYPRNDYFLTTDLQHISQLPVDTVGAGVQWLIYNVSDSIYADIVKLTQTARKQMAKTKSIDVFKPKKLIGLWRTEQENDGFNYAADLYLKKKGQMDVAAYVKFHYTDGTQTLNCDFKFTSSGTWSFKGRVLNLNIDDAKTDYTVENMVIEGFDDATQENIKSAMIKQVEDAHENNLISTLFSTLQVIKDCTATEIVFGDADMTTFQRVNTW